jgi:hypothetical protein
MRSVADGVTIDALLFFAKAARAGVARPASILWFWGGEGGGEREREQTPVALGAIESNSRVVRWLSVEVVR